MELRGFQKRIIEKTQDYLKDGTMHIVAPPGSGKTVLGSEIIKLVAENTLILVPSLVLKEQWFQTLLLSFRTDELSTDLTIPSKITITTYQDFYAKKIGNQADLYWNLLVLDEAHHLKQSWATDLLAFRQNNTVKMLSLTATPPFDAPTTEWERYIRLNGPIDEEISTSELIKENILTPYQDYVYLMPVSKESTQRYNQYIFEENQIVDALESNQSVTDYLLSQPFIIEPLEHTEFIYSQLSLYLSCLSYLLDQDYTLSTNHWKVLGLHKHRFKIQLPEQDQKSLSELYQYLYQQDPELKIFDYLEKKHWLDQDGLALFPGFQTKGQKENIPLKKAAIEHIVLKEELFLGKNLCGVIFLDYIKEKALVNSNDHLEYGMVPVFSSLTKLLKPETNSVALCGSFLLINEKFLKSESSLEEYHSLGETIPTMPNYLKISLTTANRHWIIQIITDLLNRKIINLLVGTVSLLGEGWNCPGINTMVLANSSGSFVQTQQLRGRGLRTAPDKELTNIWHIAPVYLEQPLEKQPELTPILKRLSFIEGLDFLDTVIISTNQNRFELPEIPTEQALSSRIKDTFDQAYNRQFYQHQWSEALTNGTQLAMPIFIRNSLQTSNVKEKTATTQANTRKNFFSQLTLLFFAPSRKKYRWKKYCQQLEVIIQNLYHFLQKEQVLIANERIIITWDQENFSCRLQDARYHVERQFNDILIDLLSEIDNPRYLFQVGKNYFAVPSKYGINRSSADRFIEAIQVGLPKTKLYYTKNLEGQQKLMAAYFLQNRQDIFEGKSWQ